MQSMTEVAFNFCDDNSLYYTLIPLSPAPRTDCAVFNRPNILPPLK